MSAQDDVLIVEPLFEYPTAPDTMSNLYDRSDWLMRHFWDTMNLKDKNTVDQNALNDAFQVYVAPMQYADADIVEESTNRLIQSISKNPALSLQFAKAAEEALYGPRAYLWNDKIYLKFIDNVIANKKIKKERKMRYERVGQILRNTLQGTVPPEIDYVMTDGKRAHYQPDGVITIIEFGDPDCFDCRMAKLRLSSDVELNSLIERGKLNILFILPDGDEGWEQTLADYPAKWHVGMSEGVTDTYDLRLTPALYVIDKAGKIAVKNVDIDQAIAVAKGLCN